MAQIHRGDVVLVNFPFIQDPTQSKTRPALVIQNDVGNRYSLNTIVLSISSVIPQKRYPTHYKIAANTKLGKKAGLDKDSVVQAENILTLPKALITRKLGSLPASAMDKIDGIIKVSLALK